MQQIKGFVTISQFINNNPSGTSVIGEISPISLTYSENIGTYSADVVVGYTLYSFSSIDSVSNLAEIVPYPVVIEILSVIEKCVIYSGSNIRPYVIQNYIDYLMAQFPNDVSAVQLGNFIDNGTIALPEWIIWTSLTYNTSIKIWLADQSFQSEYDNYNIIIVPPITPIDNLFGNYNTVVATLQPLTISAFIAKANAARNNIPPTFLQVLTFNLVNQLDPTETYPVNWAVLIYGIAGDNIDSIKDALTSYIIANSAHTTSQWTVIFPSIFIRNEYIVLPRWDLVSIPNLTSNSALYGDIINTSEAITFATNSVSVYSANFISTNVCVMSFTYKGITLLIINGDNNSSIAGPIQGMFNDYIPVDTTSEDFTRMSLNTQNWVIFLETLLITAETADANSIVPIALRRSTRGGLLYISGEYNSISYYVAAKSNTIYG